MDDRRMRWGVALSLVLLVGFPGLSSAQAPDAALGEPHAVFGEAEGSPDELLGSVAAIAGLDGGLWAIGDGQARTIHIVDSSGTLVRTLGGEGGGPGEFRSIGPRGLWALPDGGLGAWDPRAGRVTYFRGDAFDQVETVPVQQNSAIGRPDMFVGALRDGLLIASTASQLSEGDPGPSPDRHEVGLFGPDGQFIRAIADFGGFIRARSGTASMGTSGPIPFSPVPMVARGSDQVAFTNGESPELTVLSEAGPARSIRVEASDLARDRAWQELDELARDPDRVSGFWANVISTLDRTIGPVPVVGAVVGGPQSLWVQTYEVARHSMPFRSGMRGGPGGDWDVYDWSGNRLAAVRVPDDFVPMTVDDRWISGVRIDEMGVHSFALFSNPFQP